MDLIQVFEYDKLVVGRVDGFDFKKEHLDALVRFHKDECPYYSLIKDGVKFRQYVGILKVGDLTIEVLPKADKQREGNRNFWHSRLVQMLSRVYDLKIYMPTVADQSLQKPLLDIFVAKFLDEVDSLQNKGLVKCYRREDSNQNSLKGRVLWSKQVTLNCVHKEKFYVNHTTYDYEHTLNRILRKALEVIPEIVCSSSLRGRAVSSLFAFPELKDIQPTAELFSQLQFDRKTDDYRMAISIAKLILLNYSPDLQQGKTDIFALMFNMYTLWEEYIYRVLKQKLPDYSVEYKREKILWRVCDDDNRKPVRVQYDIMVSNGKVRAILDTKWKQPDLDHPVPSHHDLQQMYVYIKLFDADRVALVYPGNREDVDGKFEDKDSIRCDMLFIPCEDEDFNEWEDRIAEKVNGWLKKEFFS